MSSETPTASSYDTSRVPSALIAADRVKGTPVYNANDEKLGSIDSIMIDKRSGKVAYAVMSFGGFLGIGEQYHPLPWDVLDYDPEIGGYRAALDRSTLEGAPSYERNAIDEFDYDSHGGVIDKYYGVEIARRSNFPGAPEPDVARGTRTDANGNQTTDRY